MAAAWDGAGRRPLDRARRPLRGDRPPTFDRALVDAVDGRRSAARCSTSAAARARSTRRGRLAACPPGSVLGVDLSARMLERGARDGRGRGPRRTSRSCRPTRRCTRSSPARSTSRSAASARCSSPTRSPRSRTSGARSRPGGQLALLAWRDLGAQRVVERVPRRARRGPRPPDAAVRRAGAVRPGRPNRITTERLSAAGFADVTFTSIDEPLWFGRDVDDAWPFVSDARHRRAGSPHDLDDAAREAALGALRASLAAHETPDGVRYGGSAWLITARNGGAS